MSLEEVMEVAQAGKDAGASEALFTLGERPELRYDEAARWLAARGYQSTVDYVASAAAMVLEGTGLLPTPTPVRSIVVNSNSCAPRRHHKA